VTLSNYPLENRIALHDATIESLARIDPVAARAVIDACIADNAAPAFKIPFVDRTWTEGDVVLAEKERERVRASDEEIWVLHERPSWEWATRSRAVTASASRWAW
jgi:hypothetical protein